MIPTDAKKHPTLSLWVTPQGDVFGPRGKRSVQLDRYGYLRLSCVDDGKHIKVKVHALVAETFIGPRGDATVNHKDGNKINNAADNLEYLSAADNTRHGFEAGLQRCCQPVVLDGVKYYSKREMERRTGIPRRSQLPWAQYPG